MATLKASRALLEHLKRENRRLERAAVKKELLRTDDSDAENEATDNAGTPIWLSLTTKQHVVDRNCLRPSKAKVPHSLTSSSPSLSICLITADPQRAVKNIVADARFPADLATKIERVIGLSKLQARYKTFEQRRELLSQHDVFVADDRIITRLPKVLGKVFYQGTAKRPIPVNIALIPRDDAGNKVNKANKASKVAKAAASNQKGAADKTALFASPDIVAKEVSRALDSVPISLKQGTNAAIRVGLGSFTPEQLVDNINAVVDHVIEKHVVKGWRNVKAIHIKTPTSMAVPIWLADELWTDTSKVIDQPDGDAPPAIEGADPDSKSSKRKRNPKTTKGPQAGAQKRAKLGEDDQEAEAETGKESAESDAARKAALKKQKAKAFKSALAVSQ
ncbi:hypothetical protein DV737_g4901, partial [Chaetothyriales sp. CBS 132003]